MLSRSNITNHEPTQRLTNLRENTSRTIRYATAFLKCRALHADGRQRFFFQLLSLVVSGEPFDNRVERSVHDLIQLMNSQADAVVANAVLFEVISADFF